MSRIVSLFTDDLVAGAELYRHLLGSRPQSEWPAGAIFAAGDARVPLHERSASLPDGPPKAGPPTSLRPDRLSEARLAGADLLDRAQQRRAPAAERDDEVTAGEMDGHGADAPLTRDRHRRCGRRR